MEKIKQYIEGQKGRSIITTLIILLSCISSFILGRLSKSSLSPGIKIEYPDIRLIERDIHQEANALEANRAINDLKSAQIGQSGQTSTSWVKSSRKGDYFASSKGKKYYPVGCSAGKSIKIENRVYFPTESEAERAGYEKSSSCI